MLADLAAYVATVLAVIALVPQIGRLRRLRTAEGVSPTWAAFGVVTNLAWLAYLSARGLWASVPASLVVSAFYGVTLHHLAHAGARLRAVAPASAAWAAMLALALAGGGWALLGLVLGVSYGVQVAPGVWTAYRTPRPRAIAPATWVTILVEALLWGLYGLFHGDVPLLLFTITAVVASGLMLARYGATRHLWAEQSAPA